MDVERFRVPIGALRVINVLARIMGVVWLVVGAAFLLSAVVAKEHTLAYALVGVFVVITGIALLVAKPITEHGIARFLRRPEVPRGE